VAYSSSSTGSSSATFTVKVGRNEIVTITTNIGNAPNLAPVLSVPKPAPQCKFPAQLADDFDLVKLGAEAKYFQDLYGAFEAVEAPDAVKAPEAVETSEAAVAMASAITKASATRGIVMRQMTVDEPIGFHGSNPYPLTVVGSKRDLVGDTEAVVVATATTAAATGAWSVGVDFMIEEQSGSNSAFIGLAVGGESFDYSGPAIYLEVSDHAGWSFGPAVGGKGAWGNGSCCKNKTIVGSWHRMVLNLTATATATATATTIATAVTATGSIDGVRIFNTPIPTNARVSNGWAGIGSGKFGPVLFDSFKMGWTAPE
jgi:hypothetical protein